jgi:hypothetical protein
MSSSNQELKSLKIWTRVILSAPLSDLVSGDDPYLFELVKTIIEKLWQDCIVSNQRIKEN